MIASDGAILTALCLFITTPPPCSAFISPTSPLRLAVPSSSASTHSLRNGVFASFPRTSTSSLFLFRDLFKRVSGGGGSSRDDEDDDKKIIDSSVNNAEDLPSLDTMMNEKDSTTDSNLGIVVPFFAAAEEEIVEDVNVVVKEEAVPIAPTATSAAEELRARAARIRLEADRCQVELTLDKIEKLNIKLEGLKKKNGDTTILEEELGRLKTQLTKMEEPSTIMSSSSSSSLLLEANTPIVTVYQVSSSTSSTMDEVQSSSSSSEASSLRATPPSAMDVEERIRKYKEAPEFVRTLVAKTVGFDVDDINKLDAANVVQKVFDVNIDIDDRAAVVGKTDRDAIERAYLRSPSGDGGEMDNSDDDDDEMPKFTEEEIQAKVKELEDVPQFLRNLVTLNETELATSLLEDEWIEEREAKKKLENGGGFFGLFGNRRGDDEGNSDEKGEVGNDGERTDLDGRGTFGRMFSSSVGSSMNVTSSLNGIPGMPQNEVDFMMNSLYPKTTRKEGETPDQKTLSMFLNDVVAPTKAFTPTSDPISVSGGYIVRGKNTCKSGDELIEKLDRRIANDARLRDKISFFILKDPFPNPEEQMLDPLNWPQVLFVAGPNVARDSEVVLRTIISAFGIATAWYGSIYPFLSNPKLLDKATESMELADAGMQTDLSWLSEMSIPLFLSFMTLQFIHEAAHQTVARSRNFEATIPTLVPSVMSGITNSITSLKSSPMNKQALLEFAVAGPLVGMLGSILVLCYGLVLTATADASVVQSFPGIPLAVLRESSLGGGLIEIFLGNGVLSVPSSAEAAQALASTLIALHPYAVAGFVSLVVNALALVPAGRTDGGRISIALFGRSGSQAVTFASLSTLFILGITSSDLLLFYFAFIVFFQSELEIPCRNEVDDVEFSRVIIAIFAGFLMLLTLIPM